MELDDNFIGMDLVGWMLWEKVIGKISYCENKFVGGVYKVEGWWKILENLENIWRIEMRIEKEILFGI